jgi:hypothetical protein
MLPPRKKVKVNEYVAQVYLTPEQMEILQGAELKLGFWLGVIFICFLMGGVL